jgi:thiol-disulfide isomerase/thioredoxin
MHNHSGNRLFVPRRMLRMVLLLSLCVFLLCGSQTGAEAMHDFTAFNFLDNREISTSDMRGSIIVMLFGSIYCKPCIELLPVMHTLQERYAHTDVQFLLLDIDLAVDPVLQKQFIERHAISLPYIINAHQIAKNNRVFMLPTTLIIGRDGEVTNRIHGFKRIRTFESALKKLGPVRISESGAEHDHGCHPGDM